jgi:hypothetical protein
MKKSKRLRTALTAMFLSALAVYSISMGYVIYWESVPNGWNDVKLTKGILKYFSGRSQNGDVVYVDEKSIYCLADPFGSAFACPVLKQFQGQIVEAKYVTLSTLIGNTNLLLEATVNGGDAQPFINATSERELKEIFKNYTKRLVFLNSILVGLAIGFLYILCAIKTKKGNE